VTYPQQPEVSDPKPPARPRTGLVAGIVVAVVVLLGGITTWLVWPAETTGNAVGAPPQSASTTTAPTVSCAYSRTPDQPAAKDVGQPENGKAPAAGTVRVTLKTEHGEIPMTLDRAKAPCAVQNFLFLAKKKYFDGTPCHRMTTGPGFKVLQCGDPSGSGQGGPGYQFDDELPRGLTPSGANAVVYPAGTVAMANAGPDTNGSQFFLVYGDTTLAPSYSVFGTYGGPGQTTIDQIAAGGVAVEPAGLGPDDGKPNKPVTIQAATAEN
jgi:peptidyl-prolyl cis-trans isomerase B (cyclophilin B)